MQKKTGFFYLYLNKCNHQLNRRHKRKRKRQRQRQRQRKRKRQRQRQRQRQRKGKMPVMSTLKPNLGEILKEFLNLLTEGCSVKQFYRKLFAMGQVDLCCFAGLLEAKIDYVGSSALQSGRADISPGILQKMRDHHKFICEGLLPLCRMLEFFQRINPGKYRNMRIICGWTFNVGFYFEGIPKNYSRLSCTIRGAAQVVAMRKMLQELRKKVTTLPQWSQLLNGFEKVKTATQVQNFLQELEKVVGRKFPKFLHHLSEFIHCSSSDEMTNTVLGAIVELCAYYAKA